MAGAKTHISLGAVMKHQYSYVLLRYVHDILAGEQLNVGVVVYERLVTRCDDREQPERRTDEDVWRRFKRDLESNGTNLSPPLLRVAASSDALSGFPARHAQERVSVRPALDESRLDSPWPVADSYLCDEYEQ